MQSAAFEPMSIGQILDRTFKIYKNNFVRFIAIVAIIHVPITLLTMLSTSVIHTGIAGAANQEITIPAEDGEITQEMIERQMQDSYPAEKTNPAVYIFGAIGFCISIISSILGTKLCQAALTKSVSEYYLGNDISVKEAYGFVFPKILSLIGASILIAIIVYAGLILLVVPGVIFSLWYALTTPAILAENLKARSGMKRSKALASGNLGKIFAVAFLASVITYLVALPFSYGGTFVSTLIFRNNFTAMTIVNQFSQMIGTILALPIAATAYILLYYDLRIRKEAFDLEMLAQTMESQPNNSNEANVNPTLE